MSYQQRKRENKETVLYRNLYKQHALRGASIEHRNVNQPTIAINAETEHTSLNSVFIAPESSH